MGYTRVWNTEVRSVSHLDRATTKRVFEKTAELVRSFGARKRAMNVNRAGIPLLQPNRKNQRRHFALVSGLSFLAKAMTNPPFSTDASNSGELRAG